MKQIAPSNHAVTFVLLSVLLDMVGFGLIIPVLPGLIEDVGGVGLSQASVIGGWMFFAFSVAQFAFSPLMGNLSDRFGRRPLLLLAIAGLGVAFRAKPLVKQSAKQAISTLGLDGVLYLLGFRDRDGQL